MSLVRMKMYAKVLESGDLHLISPQQYQDDPDMYPNAYVVYVHIPAGEGDIGWAERTGIVDEPIDWEYLIRDEDWPERTDETL